MSYNPYAVKIKRDPGEEYRSEDYFEGPEREKAVAKLAEHMIAISGDDSGSDPRQYLSEEDAKTLESFRSLASRCHGEGAMPISLRTGRQHSRPVWKRERFWNHNPLVGKDRPLKNNHLWVGNDNIVTAKAGLTKALFFPKTGQEHQAYIFGRLSIEEPAQLVAYCIDDGKLRSLRSRDLPRSYGDGWGRLPDAELMSLALIPGESLGVNYKNATSKPLKKLLLGMLPESALTGVDPYDWGLTDKPKEP